MSIFSPSYYRDSTGFFYGTGCTAHQVTYINHSFSCGMDSRGNKHTDTTKIAELQRLLTKHPNRIDLKMELQRLQKNFSPKIGKRKKKK